MKKGVLLPDGRIACPVCRSTEYRLKRSVGAKVGLGVVALPLILAAPKRMKCLSCGELYEARAEIPKAPPNPSRVPPPSAPAEIESTPVGPLRTLRLKRSFAFGPCVTAVLQVRPDLTPAQAKQMLKDSKNGPQVLLADKPQIVVDMAAALLKKAGVDTEVV